MIIPVIGQWVKLTLQFYHDPVKIISLDNVERIATIQLIGSFDLKEDTPKILEARFPFDKIEEIIKDENKIQEMEDRMKSIKKLTKKSRGGK